jgi:NitT/TauT family transport system ATP-binding protein
MSSIGGRRDVHPGSQLPTRSAGAKMSVESEDGLLSLRKIRKVYYSSGRPKVVLDDIDLQITNGEFVALVGPSGAGKSTMLRLILGEEEPTSGQLSLDGEPLGYPDTRRGIVPQQYGLFPHLTLLENIMVGDRLSGEFFRRSKNYKEAEELLGEADLSEHKDKYPYQLSGGQRQRAAVMQALIKKPKILLMDEPFGALDPGTRERMQIFILRIWEQRKKTILFVTHDLEEAVFLAPRIVALSSHDGQRNAMSGSRIVFDEAVRDREALSTEAKKDQRFTDTIERIRDIAFEPDYERQVRDFDDHHSNSFATFR